MLALIGSVCCLAIGLVLVLVFSHIYVVPHLRTQKLISAQCYVESIESRNTRTNAPCLQENVTASSWETDSDNEGETEDLNFYHNTLDTIPENIQIKNESSKRNARNILQTKLHSHDSPDNIGTTVDSKLAYTKPVFENCQDNICHIVKVRYYDLEGNLKSGILFSSGLLDFTGDKADKVGL